MKSFAVIHQVLLIISVMCTGNNLSSAQETSGGAITSIFHPLTGISPESLKLIDQKIKVDLFDGYAAVYSEYWINNSSDSSVNIYVGFPELNIAGQPLYWLRVSINAHPPFVPQRMNLDSMKIKDPRLQYVQLPESYFWEMKFQPGVTQITIKYGIGTDAHLFSGKKSFRANAFRYHLNDEWKAGSTGTIWFRMNKGLTTGNVLRLEPDKNFLGGNSIIYGSIPQLADSSDKISVCYQPIDSSEIKLSRISWEMLFRKLELWQPDEKTLTTLSPFSVSDMVQHDDKEKAVQGIPKIWGIIGGAILILIGVVILFRKRQRKITANYD